MTAWKLPRMGGPSTGDHWLTHSVALAPIVDRELTQNEEDFRNSEYPLEVEIKYISRTGTHQSSGRLSIVQWEL